MTSCTENCTLPRAVWQEAMIHAVTDNALRVSTSALQRREPGDGPYAPELACWCRVQGRQLPPWCHTPELASGLRWPRAGHGPRRARALLGGSSPSRAAVLFGGDTLLAGER